MKHHYLSVRIKPSESSPSSIKPFPSTKLSRSLPKSGRSFDNRPASTPGRARLCARFKTLAEPVSRKRPEVRSLSTASLMAGKSSGAFWTSSITTSPLMLRTNPSGAPAARARVVKSSSDKKYVWRPPNPPESRIWCPPNPWLRLDYSPYPDFSQSVFN